MFNSNTYHPVEHLYNENSHPTPNSRIAPISSTLSIIDDYHTNHSDYWRQPARTSSLQHPESQTKQQFYYDRESLIDPAGHHGYSSRETFIEPNMSTLVIEPSIANYSMHKIPVSHAVESVNPQPYRHQKQHSPHIKSNIQLAGTSTSAPLHVQHAYVNVPQHSVAVCEQISDFNLQPVPQKKKLNSNINMTMKPSSSTSTTAVNSNKLPKPPLTPLVIPPTPIRSSSSPNSAHFVATTPTRSSSMQQNSPAITTTLFTPGGLSTPGSSRSANSPLGLSPFYSPSTPSPNTALSHHTLPSPLGSHSILRNTSLKKAISSSKKLSLQPENKAEGLVHEGIKYHEAGKLEQATDKFKQASILNLPIAMFLYGVSLRHGWGCKRNEHLAFQYLQRAAEHAVEDLNNLSNAVSASASKGELIMAIYELGVSFRHGWGCKKNKETAVYYFKIAADLNDADAQNDLGHCYYHGHGVKKNLFMAAKYYRMADKQGQGIMGNNWIWKSKYDSDSKK